MFSRSIKWAALLAGTTFAVTSLLGCDQITSLLTGFLGGMLSSGAST